MSNDTRPEHFKNHIQERGQHVANYLNTLTPYERSLVLSEAQRIWDDRREGRPQPYEADDSVFFLGHWLSQVFTRLSPAAQAYVIEMVQEIDNTERFERLVRSGE